LALALMVGLIFFVSAIENAKDNEVNFYARKPAR